MDGRVTWSRGARCGLQNGILDIAGIAAWMYINSDVSISMCVCICVCAVCLCLCFVLGRVG